MKLHRKSLASILVIGLMLLAFIAYSLPAHAYINTAPGFCNNASLASGTTIVYTLGCTTAAEITLTIVVVICNAASVTGIADTSTNTWTLVVADSASWTGVGGTGDAELWYSQMKASTPSTDTITVSLSQTLACISEVYNGDTSSYVLSKTGKVHSAQTGPFTNLYMNSATFAISPNSVVFELGLWNLISSSGTFSITFNNLGVIRTANSQNIKPAIVQWTTAGQFLTAQSSASFPGIFSVSNSGATFPQVLTGVFIPNGLTQAVCGPPTGNCIPICGGSALSASTTPVVANQTYFYLGQTLPGGLAITNLTTRLSSISLTNNQKSVTVEIAVYSVFGRLAGPPNLNAITAQNPLIKFAQKDYTLANSPTAQTLQFNPFSGGLLPSDAWFAISLSVSHTGVNVFQTTTTNTMQNDPNDGFAPIFITQYSSSTPSMYLTCSAKIQTQTITTTSVVLAITTTQTITGLLNNATPQQSTFWFMPLLFILFPISIFLPVAGKARIKGHSLTLMLMLGVSLGAMIGAFANVVPLPLMILAWSGFFVSALRASTAMKPYTIMLLPIMVMTIGGLMFSANPDFVNITGNGFPNNWQGCISTCTITDTIKNIGAASIFAKLIAGDFFGFIASLFNPGAQTASPGGIGLLVSVAVSLILLILGSGVAVSILGSGFAISDAGTRMAQSLGIGLLLYSVTFGVFGGWLTVVSGDWGLNVFLPLLLGGITMFGAYLNGKSNVV